MAVQRISISRFKVGPICSRFVSPHLLAHTTFVGEGKTTTLPKRLEIELKFK